MDRIRERAEDEVRIEVRTRAGGGGKVEPTARQRVAQLLRVAPPALDLDGTEPATDALLDSGQELGDGGDVGSGVKRGLGARARPAYGACRGPIVADADRVRARPAVREVVLQPRRDQRALDGNEPENQ